MLSIKVTTSKPKNAESFYITKGYVNDKDTITSIIVRKLGTSGNLLVEHGPTREHIVAWAREEARPKTIKYKKVRRFKSLFTQTDS